MRSARSLTTLTRIRAERARRSLPLFVQRGWHVLEPNTPLEWWWHHQALSLHLQRAFLDWLGHQRDPAHEQVIQNLLANVPPGTLKSRIVSVYFPAWAWLHCPSWRPICLSANPSVALRDASFSRQVIESKWYQETFQPEWELREDQNAKSNFGNTEGGFRLSRGWGARIVGDRGDAIIGDDPNDMQQIHSETIREGVNEAWDNAIANRVNDLRSSLRIVIQQRGHERDFSGHVIAKGDMKWARLVIPMEYDPASSVPWAIECDLGELGRHSQDPRRKPGEILQPGRFTPPVLDTERKRGSYYYAGQFQQRPAPAGGALFRRSWWRFCRYQGAAEVAGRPDGCDRGAARPVPPIALRQQVISLDAAFKGEADSDFVVFTVWGWDRADRYLLDVRRGRWTFGETVQELRRLSAEYPRAIRKLVEDKANGSAIIDTLQSELGGIVPVNPEGGKVARAHAVAPQVEAGNVFLLDGAPWLEEYVGEHDSFPRGANDDQVDSSTQALIDLGARDMAIWGL